MVLVLAKVINTSICKYCGSLPMAIRFVTFFDFEKNTSMMTITSQNILVETCDPLIV